jgi:hypothetical protein
MATAAMRDPERPKAPLTAYFRYAAAYREKHGMKGGTETMKKIGEAWRALGEAEKKPFMNVYEAERKIYQAKFKTYKESGKLEAWKKDPAEPKRPPSPYLTWSSERRKAPQYANLSMTEATKQIAVEWKSVPKPQKDVLESKFKSSLETFKKDMEAYKASGKKEAWLEKTGRLAAIKKAETNKDAAKKKELEAKAKAKAKAAADKEKLKLKKQKEKEAKAKLAEKKAKEQEKLKLKRKKEKEAKEKEQLKAKAAKAKAAKAKAAKPTATKAKAMNAKTAKSKSSAAVELGKK